MFHQVLLQSLAVPDASTLVNLSAPGPKPGFQSCGRADDCDVVFTLIGLAGVIGVGKGAQSILFQMTGADSAVLALSAVALALVALCAGFIPAHRASRVDPMRALKYEYRTSAFTRPPRPWIGGDTMHTLWSWEGEVMAVRLCVLALVLASLPVIAPAQTALPPDIDPVTLSRLPWVTPQDLDEEGKQLLAKSPEAKPGPGPTHVTRYSPRERSLGIPSGVNSPVGARYFQLAVLIIAREIDQQYEWSAHEPAGLRQGLEQSVIDVVKYNRDVAGLSDKDATFITFGRTLYREHRVSSELWKKMIGHFGRQHTVQLMMIMGDYFRVGFMMNAVDQHLPPERKPLLPPLKR